MTTLAKHNTLDITVDKTRPIKHHHYWQNMTHSTWSLVTKHDTLDMITADKTWDTYHCKKRRKKKKKKRYTWYDHCWQNTTLEWSLLTKHNTRRGHCWQKNDTSSFTAAACKISGLKNALTRLQTILFPVLLHIYLQCYAFWWKSFHMQVRQRKQS